jgi:hypothetical protein
MNRRVRASRVAPQATSLAHAGRFEARDRNRSSLADAPLPAGPINGEARMVPKVRRPAIATDRTTVPPSIAPTRAPE